MRAGLYLAGWLAFVDEHNDIALDSGEGIVNAYTGMSASTVVTSAAFTNTISYFPPGMSYANGSFIVCEQLGGIRNFYQRNLRDRVADSTCPQDQQSIFHEQSRASA